MFWEYHADGSELVFLEHQVTQAEIDAQEIVLPQGVLSVISVLGPGNGSNGGGTGIATINLQYQMYITDVMNPRRLLSGTGLSSWYITQSYLGMMSDTFSAESRLNFNKHHDRLTLLDDWAQMTDGCWVAIECYRVINPEKVGEVYNNRWLKKYTTALFKKQWGSNLIKFAGATLPGGVTVNAEQIHNDAKEEVKNLEDELKNDYQLPVDFYMG